VGSSCFSFPIYIYIYIYQQLLVCLLLLLLHFFLQVFVVFRFGEENAGYKIYAKVYLLTASSSLLLFEKVLETLLRKSLGYGCVWLCFFIVRLKGAWREIGTFLGYDEFGLWVFRVLCRFHVWLKESWRNWELRLWGIVGYGFRVCCFHVRLRRADAIWIGALVESNWFWGMKNHVKFVIVCAIVIISFQYVFQCGHVVHTNFDFVDNEL
jgi:hypothetical protein